MTSRRARMLTDAVYTFAGKAGSFYNVIQDLTHQVTMRLKIGILSDHIGTYIVSSATPLAPPSVGHPLSLPSTPGSSSLPQSNRVAIP